MHSIFFLEIFNPQENLRTLSWLSSLTNAVHLLVVFPSSLKTKREVEKSQPQANVCIISTPFFRP